MTNSQNKKNEQQNDLCIRRSHCLRLRKTRDCNDKLIGCEMFEVWIRGEKVKEYQHKIQAVIYLAMHGLVYGNCFKGYWIDPKAQIKKMTITEKVLKQNS